MADKKLNAVSTAKDGAYIYAEDASGNQIKISKADLASVVAEVMGSPVASKGNYTGNANEMSNNGIYYNNNSSITNLPNSYGTLIVFKSAAHIVQIYMRADSVTALYARQRNSGTWSDWKEL